MGAEASAHRREACYDDAPMTTQTSELITARVLAESPPVAAAVDTIIAELKKAQATIAEVRPPNPELADVHQDFLKRQTVTKGRKPYYSYIGSGLGNGPLVQLRDGSVKWDMINGIGVHMFGHSDPDLVRRALCAAMTDTVMQGNLQFNPSAIEAAEFLLAEASRTSKLGHCFLINSGALANESALKLCFQRNAPANRVLAFRGCFAGRTTTMAQIGDSAAARVGIPLTVPVDYIPFYDEAAPKMSTDSAIDRLRAFIQRYPRQHACFMMELVQGEGGFNVAPPEFFVSLIELCRENGIAVWFDEVQTFGRTTEMFYFETLGLGNLVDVVTVGKLSQFCACLYTEEYNPKPGLLSATFVGSTVAIQVGLEMLTRLRNGGYYGPDGRIATLHQAFRRHAQELVDRHPEWFPPIESPYGTTSTNFYGGVGGMMRLTPFGGDRHQVIAAIHAMYDAGVIAFYCGHDTLHVRFLPPVGVMQPEQFEDVFRIVETAFSSVASE